MEGLAMKDDQVTVSLELLARIIVEWSEADPPTLENVRKIDLGIFVDLNERILAGSGIRGLAEKKDSNASSSPPSRAVRRASADDSPPSSAT